MSPTRTHAKQLHENRVSRFHIEKRMELKHYIHDKNDDTDCCGNTHHHKRADVDCPPVFALVIVDETG